MLGLCHQRGIDPALVTCDVDNEASRRTIERNGGVYEDTRQGKLRYWLPTAPTATLAPQNRRLETLASQDK
jgi:predicted acetyltransferase